MAWGQIIGAGLSAISSGGLFNPATYDESIQQRNYDYQSKLQDKLNEQEASRQFGYNEKAAESNYERTQRGLVENYAMQKKGMEAAGMNPALMYGGMGGAGGAGGSQGNAGVSAQHNDVSSYGATAAQRRSAIEANAIQGAMTISQMKLNEAAAKKATAEAAGQEIDNRKQEGSEQDYYDVKKGEGSMGRTVLDQEYSRKLTTMLDERIKQWKGGWMPDSDAGNAFRDTPAYKENKAEIDSKMFNAAAQEIENKILEQNKKTATNEAHASEFKKSAAEAAETLAWLQVRYANGELTKQEAENELIDWSNKNKNLFKTLDEIKAFINIGIDAWGTSEYGRRTNRFGRPTRVRAM